MTYFQAYLLTRLDVFQHSFFFVLVVSGLVWLITFFLFLVCHDGFAHETSEAKLMFKKISIISLFIFSFSGIAKSLIPSTREAAFIYIAPAIVNNQDIQKTIKKLPELSGLGLEYLSEILKQEIKDTKKEAVQDVKTAIKQGKNEK